MKRRYKSSQIPTGGKPLVAPDISPSLRREEQYRQQNQAMISAQMATNNQILAGNAKRLEQDLLYSEKQRNKFKDDVIRDAGGIWSTLAEFSPTVSKLLEEQAAQSEERAHSYDEIQAAVNYMRNGGPSEESQAIEKAVDADTSPADLAQITRQVGADGQPGLAAKLVGHVHGANLKKAEVQFLDEAGSSYGSLATQELTTSDDELQFQTDAGDIVTQTVAEAWASDNVVAQRAALSHVHRKISEGFGIRNFPLDSIENSKWFDLTRQWDSIAMKRKAEASWVARSEQSFTELSNIFESEISRGKPEALNNLVKGMQGHSVRPGHNITGSEIQSKVVALVPDLYRLKKIDRAQIAVLLEQNPYFRSKGGKDSYMATHEGNYNLIMKELDAIDKKEQEALDAQKSADKERSRNAIIKASEGDQRVITEMMPEHVAKYGKDPQLEAYANSSTMQVAAINAHTNRVNDMMLSGTFTEQDWKNLPPVVREKLSNRWNDYKAQIVDPTKELGIDVSMKDLVRQGLGFSKEDADKQFGHVGKLVMGALQQEHMAIARQMVADKKYGSIQEALLPAYQQLETNLKGVNFGADQQKEHWFYFGPDKGFPNIMNWYSERGVYNTPEQNQEIYNQRAKKLSTNHGGHPDAYLKKEYWGEDGLQYVERTLNAYQRSPYNYTPPRIIQAIAANKGLTTGQVMNQLAPLVGMGQLPDPQRDHELFRSLPQATIERLQDKVNCATETSARIIGAACANTGQAMWTSTRYAEPIMAKVPDAEQQLYVGGLFDAVKFGRQPVKIGQAPTVNQLLDKWNEIQGNPEQLAQELPQLTAFLEKEYPEMNTASLIAAMALTTGLGPVPELEQLGTAGWRNTLSTYGKFSYRSTGDKRFLALTAAQPSRNLTPPIADTQVSQAQLHYKPGDLLAALPNESKEDKYLRLIGFNEGMRTIDGGYTEAYDGHEDIGDRNINIGSVSASVARGTAVSNDPRAVDDDWRGRIRDFSAKHSAALQSAGLKPGSFEFETLEFAINDLNVQAPAAVPDFIKKIPEILKAGVTRESIAKARADSYFHPRTGKLHASGFGNDYNTLYADQLRRSLLLK